MPEIQPKFEHSALEEDIKRLSAEIKEKGLVEKGKEGVQTALKNQMPIPAAPQSVSPPANRSQSQNPNLPKYLSKDSPETKLKVEKLLDLALHKGIKKAVSEAKTSGPLILDAFHDALVDKLYGELKNRGLIK